MYERANLFSVVARPMVCMHLDMVQVVRHMAAIKCKQNKVAALLD